MQKSWKKIQPLANGYSSESTYSARAFRWIPTWQGLDGFKIFSHPCALDESSLSIGRVKKMKPPFTTPFPLMGVHLPWRVLPARAAMLENLFVWRGMKIDEVACFRSLSNAVLANVFVIKQPLCEKCGLAEDLGRSSAFLYYLNAISTLQLERASTSGKNSSSII